MQINNCKFLYKGTNLIIYKKYKNFIYGILFKKNNLHSEFRIYSENYLFKFKDYKKIELYEFCFNDFYLEYKNLNFEDKIRSKTILKTLNNLRRKNEKS